MDQLRELVARIVSRPLDRSRPLWEVYFVEGLGRRPGRGPLQVPPGPRRRRRDRRPRPGPARHQRRARGRSAATTGAPRGAPSPLGTGRRARRATRCSDPTARARHRAQQRRVGAPRPPAGRRAAPVAVAGALTNRRPARESPINGRALAAAPVRHRPHRPRRLPQDPRGARRHGQRRHPGHRHRRAARLADDPRRVAGAAAPDPGRGADVGDRRRARGDLARQPDRRPPASTSRSASPAPSSGCTRCPTPSRRTRRPAAAVAANRLAGDRRLRARRRSTRSAPGSPPRSCAAASSSRSPTCPARSSPLYAAGARMLETYPVHPLLPGHALAIGVTSYDGGVFYGITADRDLLPDVDVLGQCVTEALDELLDTASGARAAAPRGRKKPPPKKARPSDDVRVYLPATLRGAGAAHDAAARVPADADAGRRRPATTRTREYAALMDRGRPCRPELPATVPRRRVVRRCAERRRRRRRPDRDARRGSRSSPSHVDDRPSRRRPRRRPRVVRDARRSRT